MRAFYSLYELGNIEEIKLRFEMTNQTQISFVYAYIEHMIDSFLSQGSDYQNIALGTLMQKSINNSYSLIEETLPLDLTTRTLACWINRNAYNCHTYIDYVTTNKTLQDSICTQYNFTDVDSLKAFVNATWYYADPSYMQTLQDKTKLTTDELDKLYDYDDNNSFAAALQA